MLFALFVAERGLRGGGQHMATWSVLLQGSYVPYDSAVNAAIEESYQKNESDVEVSVRGTRYLINFGELKQRQVSDTTRQRVVKRERAAAVPSAEPTPKRQQLDENSSAQAPPAVGSSAAGPVPAPPTATTSAAIVFAPGAGGSTAKAMVKLHEQLEARGIRVWRCDPDAPPDTTGAWKGWVTTRAGSGKNVGRVKAVCELAAQAMPDATIFLCGASFGNRVIAEVMREHRDELPPRVSSKMICCGYPLHGDGNPENHDPKRLAHLLQLPTTTEVLFLSGKYDTHLGSEGRGLASLRDVMAQMTCTTTLVEVPHGEHTVPNVKYVRELKAQHGLTVAQVADLVRDAIVDFVSVPSHAAAAATA